ncbi:MAG TPA: guanylate kinase [Acidimicrobiia bacterium]|nr:guanylate kinase [Acidimicrobiia bacterium]
MVSGPSGAGKTSVVAGLADRMPFCFSVSLTTRPARPGEVDGVAYRFVDRERFLAARDAGELIEWAEYSGHLYGTPRAPVQEALAAGRDVLLDIEVLGAEQVKAAHPEAVMVFIEPPSLEALEARLRGRGDTGEEQVARRLQVARWQMNRARGLFDHFVVNDRLTRAIDEVAGILVAPGSPGSPR